MQDASTGVPARFRPTWQQALGRGLYLGALLAVLALAAGLLVVLLSLAWEGPLSPPAPVWVMGAFGPPLLGSVLGVLLGRRYGTDIDAGGIHRVRAFASGVEPWSQVVDLRAERRGGRTVVSVYLDSGASVQLPAPYDGEFFAADPQFERKLFALSHLWRSHRFGGLAG
jgi:uncharacterized iron-regulated membrane protein